MSLLIAGVVAFDSIKTPFDSVDKILGGPATFAALSSSYFNSKPRVVSVVGGDFPEEYLELLKRKGSDIEGIKVVKEEKTFFWAGEYHNDMNTRTTLATDVNVFENFDAKVPESYKDSDYLLLGNLHPSLQLAVLNQMNKRPKLVVLDTMNFWMDNFWDETIETIKHVDVLTINDEEARQLSGEYSLVKAARKILTMGPKYLVIKKGEHGALLFDNENIFFAPALPLEEVFDPTGAGDTFAGGFIGHIESTDDISLENMKRAVIYGSAMASFSVEKFGPNKIIDLSDQEMNDRIAAFEHLTKFEM
jgi:sugar/nucleoside kinase (ribokinase family)